MEQKTPYITLPTNNPGIVGLFDFSPQTAGPMKELAQTLLRTNASENFSAADRELIATYVSFLNECNFCYQSHAAIARHLSENNKSVITDLINDKIDTASISPKLKSLLHIAGRVQQSGRAVTLEDIHQAKAHGADDTEIHDTVLIAAFFCMNNRYVDGLKALTPSDYTLYDTRGKITAQNGYIQK
jgi:uncharacterized peroxidase-related enzyme